jgi:transcription initiation factor IIE alpha subunit
MAVRLDDACPLMREACRLGKEAGVVYAVLWEAAWHDQRGRCGGTTELSHKAMADLCHMSKTTVLKSIDLLLDDGLIAFLYMVPSRQGSWKRKYRVMHPDHVETQRAILGVYDKSASERAKELATYRMKPEALQC